MTKQSNGTSGGPGIRRPGDAARSSRTKSTEDIVNSTLVALNWTVSAVYLFLLYYIQMIIQAGLCTALFIFGPIVQFFGVSRWNFADGLYELHECAAVLLWIGVKGTQLYFYGDVPEVRNKKEKFIVISNHQVESDYFVMAAAMEKTGNLSRMRHVMKRSLVWVPYVGGFLVGRKSFFIDRSNLNWQSFDNNCAELREANVPTCVLIYPEGTTWNNALEHPVLFEKSRKAAQDAGREPFRHVLFPRHRGFYRLLSQLRSDIDAVYDLTFAYSSTRGVNGRRQPAPGILEFTRGDCTEVHVHFRRISIQDVPVEEGDVRKFLIDRLDAKDRLLDTFFTTGSLPDKAVQLPLQSNRHLIQSLLVISVAILIGFTSTGYSYLGYYLLLPLVIGYMYVAHHVLKGK